MSKLNKYLKSKEFKKLLKSVAKEWEKAGLLSDADLSSVAGGEDPILVPLDVWKESMRNAGYVLQAYVKEGDVNFYYRCYNPKDVVPFKDNYYPVRGADGQLYMQVD